MRENFRSKIQFNKKIILRLIAIFLFFQILFCASAKRYVANRGNDLKDIVNIGVEKDVYGIGIQMVTGLGYQTASSGTGYGLRYGQLGLYRTGDNENLISIYDYEGENFSKREEQIFPGDSNLFISTNYHQPQNTNELRVWNKKIMKVDFLFRRCYSSTGVIYKEKKMYKGTKCAYNNSYLSFPIEASVGLFLGFRIGFNVMEVFDFIFGIIGFDPMNDDISNAEPLFIKLPKPLHEKKDWESKLDALDEKMDKRLNKK
jgi:hypothetical protein